MFIVHPKYSVIGIGYQVLGQFLHLRARGTFGYIIRLTLFFDAEWITLDPNKEKRTKKKKKGKKEKKEKRKKIFPSQGFELLPIRSEDLYATTELPSQA